MLGVSLACTNQTRNQRVLQNPLGPVSSRRSHPEFPADHVTQSIAHMCARRIGFIYLMEHIAVGVLLPLHPLQVLDQLLAPWIDGQRPDPRLAASVSRP
jgi:hypothetical protein